MRGDDAVLIGNRFDRALPIVDEVDDAAALPEGALAAVEVAEAGATVALCRIRCGLRRCSTSAPQEARAARHAARAVAGKRAAIVVREAGATTQSERRAADVDVRRLADGTNGARLDAAVAARGGIGRAGAAGSATACSTRSGARCPRLSRDPGFPRRLEHRRALALALLGRDGGRPLHAELAGVAPGGVRMSARSGRPRCSAPPRRRARRGAVRADLGGGTVDLHRDGRAIAARAPESS